MDRYAWKDEGALVAAVSEAAEWYGRVPAIADLSFSFKQASSLGRRMGALVALTESQRRRIGELEARNEALEAFAYSVAHDLKGSLSAMISYAELVQDVGTELSAEERQLCLGRIAWNGWKLNSVVDALLLLAAARREEVPAGPVDMAAVVCQARERLVSEVEHHGAELVVPSEWPVALGYGPWIEEVWVNYVSNAIHYGGRPPYIELGAVQEDSFGCFWVRDNGRGLAPGEQAALFSPTAPARRVRKRGHGLGLKIVRQIVERLGGTVGLESELGQGSTFYFTLPLAQQECQVSCYTSPSLER